VRISRRKIRSLIREHVIGPNEFLKKRIIKNELRKVVRKVLKEQYPSPYASAPDEERDDYERGRWDAIDGKPPEKDAGMDYDAGYEDGIDEEKQREREMYGV